VEAEQIDKKAIYVLSLCDGIATGLDILKELYPDRRIIYVAVELDKIPRTIADVNHPAQITREIDDVVEMSENFDSMKYKYFDYFLCGFTCKSLSSAGNRDEWEGESKIFFPCVEILNKVLKINPNCKFFFENVASMRNTCRDTISELLLVPHYSFNAAIVSPQARVRYYWFNFSEPEITEELIRNSPEAKTVLDEDGLDVIGFTKSHRVYEDENGNKCKYVQGRFRADKKLATIVTKNKGGNGQSTCNMVMDKKMNPRHMTVMECARAQGMGHYNWDVKGVSVWGKMACIGNGWQREAVKFILKGSVDEK
jgi:site-specific DNA-cytosine methylase